MWGGPQGDWQRDLAVIAASATVAGLGDAELLERFRTRRDLAAESAFEAIVARHGPMVLAVCHRCLRNAPDVDDAFQATFLVLARRAPTLRLDDSLAPWLYTVARRVAARARSRRRPETRSLDSLDLAAPESSPFAAESQSILDEELTRLPQKYRDPIVLCLLEGLTHQQAAQHLRCPVGTLSGRLSRARVLLRDRLSRRGLGTSATATLALLVPREGSAVSPLLLRSTARVVRDWSTSQVAPLTVLQLCRGVLIAMTLTHRAVLGPFVFALVALAATAAYQATAGTPDQPPSPAAPPTPNQTEIHSPQLSPPIPVFWRSIITTDQYVAVLASDNRSIKVLSLLGENPEMTSPWTTYTPPDGVQISPIEHFVKTGGKTVALAFEGPEIREISIYNIRDRMHEGLLYRNEGRWITFPLRTPAKGKIQWLASPEAVIYKVADDLYLFSPAADSWTTFRLKKEGWPDLRIEKTCVLIRQGDDLRVVSLHDNAWHPPVQVKTIDSQPK